MSISLDISAPFPVSRAKAEGAFIALAAGDALGWPQELAARARVKKRPQATAEFHDWRRRRGGGYNAYVEIIRAGEYSDDTQLTLAVARGRAQAGSHWWSHFTRNELPLWTLYERGGGGATKRAAESWLRGVAPWKQADADAIRKYFDAGGNGVAMRVVPHAMYCAQDGKPADLLRDVATDGAATHGHPRALVGAAVYAYAAWWLLRSQRTVRFGELASMLLDSSTIWGAFPVGAPARNGWLDAADRAVGNYESTWRQTVEEMRALLGHVHSGLSAGVLADDTEVLRTLGAFGSAKGAGTVSAAAATYLAARHAAEPVQGVLRAAFAIGSDTDTIAAMVGGLLGALAGEDWIPREWFSVQDCEYLRQMANKLAARGATEENVVPQTVSPRDLRSLVEALHAGSREERDFGGLRRIRLIDVGVPAATSRSTAVHSWKLQASDGQTVYLTKRARSLNDSFASAALRTIVSATSKSVATASGEKDEVRMAGVKLGVANLAASANFYEGVLGLKPLKKTLDFVSFGALSLVGGRYAADLSVVPARLADAMGRNRIEIHVGDLDSMYKRLVDSGVLVEQPIRVMPWSEGERSMYCIDPDGNVIELVEQRRR